MATAHPTLVKLVLLPDFAARDVPITLLRLAGVVPLINGFSQCFAGLHLGAAHLGPSARQWLLCNAAARRGGVGTMGAGLESQYTVTVF